MITSVTLKGKWAERVGAKRSRKFEFTDGINLLVGPNGSGKSTILEAVMKIANKRRRSEDEELVKVTISDPGAVHFFDFEKGNLRTKGYFDGSAGLMGFQVQSRWMSHGESNRILAEGMLADDKIKGGAILLDEPDQALDYDGVVHLVAWLKGCVAKQAIISVHHPIIVLQPGVNVIELRKGYRKKMREHLRDLVVGK